MYTDVISDMFTRIRNAQKENHEKVSIPYSKTKFRISKVLLDSGFVSNIEIFGESLQKKSIIIELKYRKNGIPVISEIKRVSKPSKRIYTKKADVPKVLKGFGLSIISSSKGILSGKDARLKNVGGELIGIVW